MNKNLETFLKLVKENPTLEVVPMVNYEIVAEDSYNYWEGSFGKCKVTKMYRSDEAIYTGDYGFQECVESFIDNNFETLKLTDEELEKYAEEEVKKYEWEKVIVVYIELP